MGSTKRLLLIGAGRMAQVHASSIVKLTSTCLAGIADPNEEVGKAMAARFGCPWFATIHTAVATSRFDGVIIAAPTGVHASLIEDCAAARLPIFCEKPIDLSLEKVDHCLRIARSAGVPVVVAFHRRFDQTRMEVRAAIRAGSVGRVEHILQISRDPRLPSEAFLSHSGGMVKDMLIHDLDELIWLCGEKVASVQASLCRMIDPPLLERYGDYDTAAVTVIFEGGPQCQISATRRSAYGFEQRLEVFGDRGILICPSVKRSAVIYGSTEGFTEAPLLDSFPQRYEAAYLAEMEHFKAVMEGSELSRCTIEDARCSLALAELVIESARTGRSVNSANLAYAPAIGL